MGGETIAELVGVDSIEDQALADVIGADAASGKTYSGGPKKVREGSSRRADTVTAVLTHS